MENLFLLDSHRLTATNIFRQDKEELLLNGIEELQFQLHAIEREISKRKVNKGLNKLTRIFFFKLDTLNEKIASLDYCDEKRKTKLIGELEQSISNLRVMMSNTLSQFSMPIEREKVAS